jgi:hypothetical protein
MATALDKNLCKHVVAGHGVRTPKALLLRGDADRKNRGTFRGTTPRRVQESPAVPACEDAGDKPPGRR